MRQLAATFLELSYYGLDLSPYYVQVAREQHGGLVNASFVAENAESMPFRDGYRDAVTSVYLFHELPRNARRNVLREIHRVLAPGGLVVVEDSAQPADAGEVSFFLERFSGSSTSRSTGTTSTTIWRRRSRRPVSAFRPSSPASSPRSSPRPSPRLPDACYARGSMDATGAFLIVEDDFNTASVLMRLLSRIRPTEVVGTVREARNILTPWRRWTALIVDIGLPDGSGIDVVTFARSRFPLLPVLVLTGRTERTVINRSHELRAEFVCKPAEGDELMGFARRAIAFERVPNERVAWVLDEVARVYALTTRECDLVAACMANVPRSEIAEQLRVTDNTLKSQIRGLLRKTGCETLDVLCRRLLHQALGGSEIVSDKDA